MLERLCGDNGIHGAATFYLPNFIRKVAAVSITMRFSSIASSHIHWQKAILARNNQMSKHFVEMYTSEYIISGRDSNNTRLMWP